MESPSWMVGKGTGAGWAWTANIRRC